MKTKSIRMAIWATSLSAFLAFNASAAPLDSRVKAGRTESRLKLQEIASAPRPQQTAPPTREPRRIFDISKEEFVPNPDYHEPAR